MRQNTFVFCHSPNNCYHICKYPTVMQIIVSTKDDLHPHWPPLCHCRRHVGAAVTIAIAAVLSPPLPLLPLPLPLPRLPPSPTPPATLLLLLLPLFSFLPSCCLCFCHRCLPPPLPPLAVDDIATVAAAANRSPLLFPLQTLHLFYHFFYLCSP